MFWNISYYSSPLILTFLYRRGYFVLESITSLAKFSTGIGLLIAISLCMRGIGRSQTSSYIKFYRAYSTSKQKPKFNEAQKQLRLFDFDFAHWPVDFDVSTVADGEKKKNINIVTTDGSLNPFCEVAAYIAVHTFGIRMIYPGSLKLIQSYLRKFFFMFMN